jgi:yeast amino acid transporter
VETTAIAAYEARSTRSIARSSQITHWACLLLLFMVTLGIILGVKWDDCRLPGVWKFIGAHETIANSMPHTDSATIISIWDVHPDLAGVANGAIIFAVLSSANTALYISSRTLYGMTQKLRDNHMFSRWFKKTFGQVWTSTGVPAMALLVSLLAF